MNRIMAFLETCGTDASLANADRDSLANAARAAGLNANEVQALLNLDQAQLAGLSNSRSTMTCCLFAAKHVPCVFAAHGVTEQAAA